VPPKKYFRIYSWNVNGMRAVAKKGFFDWLSTARADVVALQETRVHPEQLDEAVRSPKRWRSHWVSAERKGYSGVGMYSRRVPDEVHVGLGHDEFDIEGRIQTVRFGGLTIVNGYFPNGSGRNRDHSRVPYKLDFYRRLFDRLEAGRAAGEKILVVGDWNTAHQEIDLARPTQNRRTSGFLDEEREELDRWIRSGWTDTFRQFDQTGGRYTWWSQRFGVREKNIGWRIDLALCSEALVPHLQAARIHSEVMGSDHCPISVDLDPAALE